MRRLLALLALALSAITAQAQDIHQLTPTGLCPINPDITIGAVGTLGRYVWTMRQCRTPASTALTERYWLPYYTVVDTWDLPVLADDVVAAYQAHDRIKAAELAYQAQNRDINAPDFAPALAAAKAAFAAAKVPRWVATDGSACACDLRFTKDANGTMSCPSVKAPTGPLQACRGM